MQKIYLLLLALLIAELCVAQKSPALQFSFPQKKLTKPEISFLQKPNTHIICDGRGWGSQGQKVVSDLWHTDSLINLSETFYLAKGKIDHMPVLVPKINHPNMPVLDSTINNEIPTMPNAWDMVVPPSTKNKQQKK